MKIPAGAWVVVADGGRWRRYENAGTAVAPDLRLLAEESQDNPPAHEQGDDRGGRMSAPSTPRSAMETPDLHEQNEIEFTAALVKSLNEQAAAGAFQHLFVAADPRTLGRMRPALCAATKGLLLAEINKDLTRHSPSDIADIVNAV